MYYEGMTLTMNIQEAKANLSKLVAAAERGEEAIITRRDVPVAKVSSVKRAEPRPMDIYPVHFTDEEVAEALAPAFTDEELREWGLA